MNLLIDQGNSLCKIAIYSNDKIQKIFRLKSLNNTDLQNIISKHKPNSCILSTVKKHDNEIINSLQEIKQFHVLDYNSKLPIKLNYLSPTTLGKDRIASAVGANTLFPNENILVIDFGTAITYDIVTNEANFIGGNIATGLNTLFRSLHTETYQLTLLNSNEKFKVI